MLLSISSDAISALTLDTIFAETSFAFDVLTSTLTSHGLEIVIISCKGFESGFSYETERGSARTISIKRKFLTMGNFCRKDTLIFHADWLLIVYELTVGSDLVIREIPLHG